MALFQLHPAHFTRVMAALPKVVQDNASTFISFATVGSAAASSDSSVMNESTVTLTPSDTGGVGAAGARDSPEGTDGDDDIMSTSAVMKPSRMQNTAAAAAARKSPYSRYKGGRIHPTNTSFSRSKLGLLCSKLVFTKGFGSPLFGQSEVVTVLPFILKPFYHFNSLSLKRACNIS